MIAYSEALNRLFFSNQLGSVKIGLSNIQKLTAYFDHPENHFKVVHVAGTNGKGSVSTKIAKGLELQGHKVGLFTSPHISTFRERIQILENAIDETSVSYWMDAIYQAEKDLQVRATFFELTTILALLHFSSQKVDWAVLEVGLGGRLDATNICNPELSIITSIAYDHTEILGHSLEMIAKEKGGIIKAGRPTLLGPRVPIDYIQPIAFSLHSPLHQVSGNYPSYDEENCAIAKKALELLHILPQHSEKAIQFRPPCRMEMIESHPYPFPILLDVAHNPDGFMALIRSLKLKPEFQKINAVIGLSTSKDISGILNIITKHAQHIYLVKAASPRGCDTKLLGKELEKIGYNSFTLCTSIAEALQKSDLPTIISGTFFVMAEARKTLKLNYPTDPIDLNEQYAILSEKKDIA